MKKILIVGASGFIGRNFKEYLNSKRDLYEVFSPSSSELNAMNEANVEKYLKSQYFDVIIHSVISESIKDKNQDSKKLLEDTIRMFLNFEKYRNLYGKMLCFGSGAEYNKTVEIASVIETDINNLITTDQYGLGKYIISKIIESSDNIYNLRLFGVFGKYEFWPKKFISNACCKVIKNIPISIRQNVIFDYLWIDDLCKIVEWFLEHKPQHHIYNITSGQKVDLLTLAELIIKKSEKEIDLYVCKNGLANEYTASNKRLLEEIGHFEFTKIEVSISILYDWYLERNKEIDLTSIFYEY